MTHGGARYGSSAGRCLLALYRSGPAACAGNAAPGRAPVRSKRRRSVLVEDGSRRSIRVGERFALTLTCSVIETRSVTVVPALTQLDPRRPADPAVRSRRRSPARGRGGAAVALCPVPVHGAVARRRLLRSGPDDSGAVTSPTHQGAERRRRRRPRPVVRPAGDSAAGHVAGADARRAISAMHRRETFADVEARQFRARGGLHRAPSVRCRRRGRSSCDWRGALSAAAARGSRRAAQTMSPAAVLAGCADAR